jgi:molecular chaperone HscA
MGLFTIQEPDRAPSDAVLKIALGIDLGTTHSLVGAYVNDSVVLFKDKDDKTLLPSVVLYPKDSQEILVGQQAVSNPESIFSVKRFMGKALDELKKAPLQSGCALLADDNNLAVVSTPQGIKTPIQISAEILKKLKNIAIDNLNKLYPDYELTGAVITVPAYFDDGQRQATKAAAELAGIKVLRLLNEPTAAALAYGYDKQDNGTYLVYDLGGGTFDVSLLRFNQGVFEVLATAGDTALGGDDMDACIIEYLKQFVSCDEMPVCWRKARQIKEALSNQPKIDIVLDNVNGQTKNNQKISLSCDQFDSLIKHLVDKTIDITRLCIQDAKVKLENIHQIILVGGATRVPAIYKALSSAFHLPISQEVDPDKVVAIGAALQAAKLMGQTDTVLLDIVPLSLGIELMGGVTEKIIARNTKLPVSVTQTYTTYQDNQTGFKIKVVQGERELVKDNRSLAQFELSGLPPLPQGRLRIAMTFSVDVDGLLTVTARETTTNQFHEVEVKPTYGLTQVDIDSAILTAAENAKTDIIARQLAEAQREAKKLIEYAKIVLSNLDQDDINYADINLGLANLIQIITQPEIKAIISATKTLEGLLVPVSLSYLSETLSL